MKAGGDINKKKKGSKPEADVSIEYYERVLKRAEKLGVTMEQNSRLRITLTPMQLAFVLCEEDRLGVDRKIVFARCMDYYMYGCILPNKTRKVVDWGFIVKAFCIKRSERRLHLARKNYGSVSKWDRADDDLMVNRQIEEELNEAMDGLNMDVLREQMEELLTENKSLKRQLREIDQKIDEDEKEI